MIVAVGCWRGIGATTAALLLAGSLAAHDEHGCWLIEADPAGGNLAGRMQLPASTVGGLERLAFPSERLQPLSAYDAVAHDIGRLRIVTAPVEPFRAHACHQPRLPWVPALRDLPGHVVVDVGRVRTSTPSWPILAVVDSVLMVSSPEVSAAVSSNEWMRAGGRVSPDDESLDPAKVRIVFVDAPGGVPFARTTLQIDLDDQFGAWLPWEPSVVDLVHRGARPDDRRLRRSALIAAIDELALHLKVEQGAMA
ncbi:MAG: hypothetical protein HY826_00065 [Actinobacteria bacterium]|nr:hypothetical protein [Actinomycetota bacterium]